jgi:hypothetical protein
VIRQAGARRQHRRLHQRAKRGRLTPTRQRVSAPPKTAYARNYLGDLSPASAAITQQRRGRPRAAPWHADERRPVDLSPQKRPTLRGVHNGLPAQRNPATREAARRGRTSTAAGALRSCRRAPACGLVIKTRLSEVNSHPPARALQQASDQRAQVPARERGSPRHAPRRRGSRAPFPSPNFRPPLHAPGWPWPPPWAVLQDDALAV